MDQGTARTTRRPLRPTRGTSPARRQLTRAGLKCSVVREEPVNLVAEESLQLGDRIPDREFVDRAENLVLERPLDLKVGRRTAGYDELCPQIPQVEIVDESDRTFAPDERELERRLRLEFIWERRETTEIRKDDISDALKQA